MLLHIHEADTLFSLARWQHCTFMGEMTSWPSFQNYDDKSKILLHQSVRIYVKNIPVKFHLDHAFSRGRPNKNNNNKMSSDRRSVSDVKTLQQLWLCIARAKTTLKNFSALVTELLHWVKTKSVWKRIIYKVTVLFYTQVLFWIQSWQSFNASQSLLQEIKTAKHTRILHNAAIIHLSWWAQKMTVFWNRVRNDSLRSTFSTNQKHVSVLFRDITSFSGENSHPTIPSKEQSLYANYSCTGNYFQSNPSYMTTVL